jgi:hypothetical protein
MKRAMADFSLSLLVPGVMQLKSGLRLLDKTILQLPFDSRILRCVVGANCRVPTQLHVTNPFNTTVVLHNVTTEIFQCNLIDQATGLCKAWGGRIGVFTPDTYLNIVVPPNHAVWSAPFAVYSPYSILTTFSVMIGAARSRIPIRIVGKMTVQMGNFVETIDYKAADVTTCVSSLQQQDCVGEDDWQPQTDKDCSFDRQVMNCAHRAYCCRFTTGPH